MSKHKKYTPKHRAPVVSAPKRAVRNTVMFSTVAAAATGVAVTAGVFGEGVEQDSIEAASASIRTSDQTFANKQAKLGSGDGAQSSAELAAQELASRGEQASRSDRRESAAETAPQVVLLGTETTDNAIARTEDATDGDPKAIARMLLADFGMSESQFGCLDSLWTRESNWRWNADNPTSSAYGIPQSLPGSKMASAGADWRTNPATQIRWGLGYIKDRYGSPCSAWGHSQSVGWY